MRRKSKVDDNQAETVAALRKLGCSVRSLAAVGGGMADLLVGFRGVNLLLEVKDGTKPPSKRRLNETQVTWHRDWRGQVAVVNSIDEAIEAVLSHVR